MNQYDDKVFGCFLGKCLGGNIGAPFEGMKQRTKVAFTREFVENALPNDDLDLQILWLDVVREKGADFGADDLADAFYLGCPYAPGEYAYFKRNYEKNIMPPLSGKFNNEFYFAGMGSPIRSEIWACLFPDDMDRAIACAKMDSTLDHVEYGDSYYGEIFLVALECLAFRNDRPYELVAGALSYLPDDCSLSRALRDVVAWTEQGLSMPEIEKRILRRHGNSESCMAKQNICFLIAAFLKYGNDFTRAVEEAVSCGFDADCTGATLGAILGITLGGEKLKKCFGIDDMPFQLGVTSRTEHRTVSALAREICEVSRKLKTDHRHTKFTVVQKGTPTVRFGGSCPVTLVITAPEDLGRTTVTVRAEDVAVLSASRFDVDLSPRAKIRFELQMRDVERWREGVKGEVYVGEQRIGRFGVAVERPWRVYGPYWKNEVVIPPLAAGEHYSAHLPKGADFGEATDHLRQFHLTALPDPDAVKAPADLRGEPYDVAFAPTDVVKIGENVGFFGNAVYWFETEIFLPADKVVDAQFGRNVPIKVYINGDLSAEKDGNEYFYYEAKHKFRLTLHKGVNTISFMVVNNTEGGKFSFSFTENGPCTNQYSFEIINLK